MGFDRLVLGAAIVAAAIFSLDSFTGQHLIAFLAGAAGIVLLHERLRQEFSPAVATTAAVLVLAATSLFWSMTRAASPVEAIAFALVAGAVLLAGRLPSPALRTAAWTAVIVIPFAKIAVFDAYAWSGAVARAEDVLYSPTRGLLSLTPVAYLGVIGTFFYLRRERAAAIALLLATSMAVLAAAVAAPAETGPFGHGLTPVLALVGPGLALIIEYAATRPLLAAAPLVAAAVLWNYWLMVQYTVGTVPKDEPVSFAAMVRQQADVHTRSPYAYPFAFPANVYFAWREGVPIERYELLAREPRGHDWEAAMDRSVDRFLLDGWGGAGPTPSGPVRWTAGRRVTLAFPLTPGVSGATLHLVASARIEEPAVAADLALELNGVEIGRFVAAPTPGEASFTIPASAVGRVLRAGYNRLTIVNHGIHRVNPEDTRPLGPLAARSGEIPFPVAIHRIRVTS